LLPLLSKNFEGARGRLPLFVEGGDCAMAQWHNGQSKPGLAIHLSGHRLSNP